MNKAFSAKTTSLLLMLHGLAQAQQIIQLEGDDLSLYEYTVEDVAFTDDGNNAYLKAKPVFFQDKIYTFGGQDQSKADVGIISEYDILTESLSALTTSQLLPNMSQPKAAHDGSLIYLYGGIYSGTETRDLWSFNPDGYVVEQMTENGSVPAKRAMASLTHFEGKLVLFGGQTSSGYTNDVHLYDISGTSWSEATTSGTPPSARYDQEDALIGSDWYIYGGYDGSDQNDLHVLNLETFAWSEKVFSPQLPRLFRYALLPAQQVTDTITDDMLFLFNGRRTIQGNLIDIEGLTIESVVNEGQIDITNLDMVVSDSSTMYIFADYDNSPAIIKKVTISCPTCGQASGGGSDDGTGGQDPDGEDPVEEEREPMTTQEKIEIVATFVAFYIVYYYFIKQGTQ